MTHRAELPPTADEFFWSGEGSLFDNLGGFDGLGVEMDDIVVGSLRDYPLLQLQTAFVAGVRQLFMFATGAGVALLPDLVYRPWSLEGDRIESRDVSGSLPVVQVGMVWRKGSSLPQAARDFVGVAESMRSGRQR